MPKTRIPMKCKSCGSTTPYDDGYCESCDPPEDMPYARGAGQPEANHPHRQETLDENV